MEPYVHIAVKKSNILLYNTLNGKVLQYANTPPLARFIKKVQSKENLLTADISEGYLKRYPLIHRFIKTCRKFFFGDLIEKKHDGAKPIQMMPIVNVQKDVNRIKNDPEWAVGENIKSYLSELTLYINNYCPQACDICDGAYRQFIYCNRGMGKTNELDLGKIADFLDETAGSSLSQLNITGGNLLAYSRLSELFNLLKSKPFQKSFFVYYRNIFKSVRQNKGEAPFIKADDQNSLQIFVDFPLAIDVFKSIIPLMENENTSLVFCIQSIRDFEAAQAIISQYGIVDYSFKPYYNGRNLTFFKKHIFLKKQDILKSKPSMKEIFSRVSINTSHFGHLIIMSNGAIHANINTPQLGMLGKTSLNEIMHAEILNGKSWRLTRRTVQPCRYCVFEALCPPISNYEKVIGRNNLCNVHWR